MIFSSVLKGVYRNEQVWSFSFERDREQERESERERQRQREKEGDRVRKREIERRGARKLGFKEFIKIIKKNNSQNLQKKH